MEIRPILSALMRNKTAPLLIAAQVALTLAIICNALYIIRDRLAAAARPSGTDEASLFTINFYPHRTIADVKDQQRRDLEAIRAIPGVQAAAWTNQVPMGRSGWNIGGLTTEPGQGDSTIQTAYYFSGDSLVETLGLRLVEGRDFTPDEVIENDPQKERAQPQVAIVTQALGKLLFPDAPSLIGKTFYLGSDESQPPVRIVGVVEHLQSPAAPTDDRANNSMIVPIRSLDGSFRYVVRADPTQRERVMADVEKALLAASNDRVLTGKRTFEEVRDARYAGERLMAGLLIAVTAFLLLITASGIVGMASLWVNQRRKQIGVRRALGARSFDILRYFLVENLMITSLGVVVGSGLALSLNQLMMSELELPRMPLEYLGVGIVAMAVLGLVAVFGPARRASAISPAIATRSA